MKKYQDNFNLVAGVTRTITEVLTIGRHQLRTETWRRDDKVTRREWLHRIDTRDAPYPSLACVMGAASWSTVGRPLPVIYRFFRAAILRP